MPPPSTCPDPEQLAAFAVGRLPAAQAAELEAHLLDCPLCTGAQRWVGVDDPLLRLLLGPGPPTVAASERKLANDLIARLKALPAVSTLGSTSGTLGAPPLDPAEFVRLLDPPQSPDELGRLGLYRVLGLLGAGGMGVVFRAEDTRLRRTVALKVLIPRPGFNADARRRFVREARVCAGLSHDRIVTVYEVGEARGLPFLAMELLRGRPLDRVLAKKGKLPVAEVVKLGIQIAEGLAAAHGRGLVHRDIKPANVWLESVKTPTGTQYRVKLLDFGLALSRQDARITTTGALVGTPAYMAPEQARGEPVDARADLFSLGCVLFEAATGARPFPGDTPLAVLQSLANHQPPPASSLRSDLPIRVSELVARLLAKDANQRPASAAEVSRALGNTGGPARARPRQRPRTLWMIAVVCLLLGAAAGLALWPRSREPSVEPAPASGTVIPPAVPTGEPLSRSSLVRKPALIPGVASWDLITLGHRGPIQTAAFSPDSKRLATLGVDGVLRIWDVRTGKLILASVEFGIESAYPFPCLPYGPLSWSPDGDRLAILTGSGQDLRILEPATGRTIHILPGQQGVVSAVAWDTVGGRVAIGYFGHSRVRVFDAASGEFRFSIQEDPLDHPYYGVAAVAFASGGRWLATAGKKGVNVWSTENLTLVRNLPKTNVLRLAFSPQGDRLVAGTDLIDTTTWAELGRLVWPRESPANAWGEPRWGPHGRTFTQGGVAWDVESRAVARSVDGVLSPDGETLWAWTPEEAQVGGFTLRDAATAQVRQTIPGHPIPPSPNGAAAGLTSDARTLVCLGPPGQAWVVDTGTGRLLKRIPISNTGPVVVSPNGRSAAFGTDLVDLVSGRTYQGLLALRVSCSPDGSTWAGNGGAGALILADAATGRVRKLNGGHTKPVHDAAWSPDGARLATAAEDGVVIWDVKAGTPTRLKLPTGGSWLKWSRDGRLIDDLVRLWDVAADEPVALPEGVTYLYGWSANGSVLYTGRQDRPGVLTAIDWNTPERRVLWSTAVDFLNAALGCSADQTHAAWRDVSQAVAVSGFESPHRAGVVLPLRNDRMLAVGTDGHYRLTGDDGPDDLRYVVRTAFGTEVLTPAEFGLRYGWVNDPGRVRLRAD